MNLNSYLNLMRFNKPVGILLLWLPTAWALWIANQGKPPFFLIFLLLLGTILMRAAGCVMNDLADRHVDIHVERTKSRPLACGEISIFSALILFFVLLMGSFFVLIQLPKACFYYALMAAFFTILYPFCKRFIQAPQLVLGIAFSMGIPMAFAASKVVPNSAMCYLLILNFFWVVAYDTQYAMVDRDDDLRIGVLSTALLFAEYDRIMIGLLQIITHLIWLPISFTLQLSPFFFYCWFAAIFILLYQQKLIAQRERGRCLQAFSSNWIYGFIMWVALMH